jgi:hypothetical protein
VQLLPVASMKISKAKALAISSQIFDDSRRFRWSRKLVLEVGAGRDPVSLIKQRFVRHLAAM